MPKVRCIRAFVGFGQSFHPDDECELSAEQAAEALAQFSEFFVAAEGHEPEHEES